jgi:hypothetical protein
MYDVYALSRFGVLESSRIAKRAYGSAPPAASASGMPTALMLWITMKVGSYGGSAPTSSLYSSSCATSRRTVSSSARCASLACLRSSRSRASIS